MISNWITANFCLTIVTCPICINRSQLTHTSRCKHFQCKPNVKFLAKWIFSVLNICWFKKSGPRKVGPDRTGPDRPFCNPGSNDWESQRNSFGNVSYLNYIVKFCEKYFLKKGFLFRMSQICQILTNYFFWGGKDTQRRADKHLIISNMFKSTIVNLFQKRWPSEFFFFFARSIFTDLVKVSELQGFLFRLSGKTYIWKLTYNLPLCQKYRSQIIIIKWEDLYSTIIVPCFWYRSLILKREDLI